MERPSRRHPGSRHGQPAPVRRAATALLASAAVVMGTGVIVAVSGGRLATGAGQAGSGQVIDTAAGLGQGSRQLPAGDGPGPEATARPADAARAARQHQFRGIVLPDLLVIVRTGLTSAETARLGALRGVNRMITFDGGQITLAEAGGAARAASVIGVSPGQFRSWVPLGTADRDRLWSRLAAGGLVASDAAAARLGLRPGASYTLNGRMAVGVRFAGQAPLGVAGIDLLVNQATSARLGLVSHVAALISAPGLRMSALLARVRQITGQTARLVSLRRSSLPAVTADPGPITGYLQLFRASAARYCPSLSWTVLAAIGQIESGDGQNMGPSSAGALGPMQFLPSTWAAWGIDGFGRTGPPDIMNPLDAVPSAARMLCADGAANGTAAGLRQAIFDYNHATWYVNEVLALAARYAAGYR